VPKSTLIAQLRCFKWSERIPVDTLTVILENISPVHKHMPNFTKLLWLKTVLFYSVNKQDSFTDDAHCFLFFKLMAAYYNIVYAKGSRCNICFICVYIYILFTFIYRNTEEKQ